eukprot:1181185-Prorocentrum_minimum.AAC.1
MPCSWSLACTPTGSSTRRGPSQQAPAPGSASVQRRIRAVRSAVHPSVEAHLTVESGSAREREKSRMRVTDIGGASEGVRRGSGGV